MIAANIDREFASAASEGGSYSLNLLPFLSHPDNNHTPPKQAP
jgi:hypothetical protein